MNKKVKYTFGGSNQDIAKSKHPFQFYFDGQHIRITATDGQSTGALTNEKGTELVVTLPSITIVGVTNIASVVANDDSAVLSTVNGTVDINVLANDVYLDEVTITIIQQPLNGTVTILDNNRIRYTDTSGNETTTDSFVYQIDDGTTQDTATVTTSIAIIVKPDEDGLDENPTLDENYDGIYYYYTFAPCDRTLAFFVGKSITKITDDKVYGFSGSGGIGMESKVAYRASIQETPWTTSSSITYDSCPDTSSQNI